MKGTGRLDKISLQWYQYHRMGRDAHELLYVLEFVITTASLILIEFKPHTVTVKTTILNQQFTWEDRCGFRGTLYNQKFLFLLFCAINSKEHLNTVDFKGAQA
jgi:hypothetical protein